MLNYNNKLSSKIFEAEPEMATIRSGFGVGLLTAGENDSRVVGLCADLTESTQMHLFARKFPERFIQVGVAEQNLVAVASGMAAMGKIPFTSSYAMFSPGRNWEPIRTTIAYNDRQVKIIGSHAGISVGPDGGTHQAIEDIAIMRVMPNMLVFSPCDAIQAKHMTLAAATIPKPVYMRLAREKTPVITTAETPFEMGKVQVFFSPPMKSECTIFATGALVHNALLAARRLAKDGLPVTVVNVHTIKPLDDHTIIDLVEKSGSTVSVEEHQIIGGMGSAIAELLVRHHPVPMEFVGVQDKFGQSGTQKELIEHYGLGVYHIELAVKKVISRK